MQLTLWQRWVTVQAAPLVLCGAVLIGYTPAMVVGAFRVVVRRGGIAGAASARAKLARVVDLAIGAVSTVLYYLYFVVVRGALEMVNCRPVPDGQPFLVMDPAVTCWSGAHAAMLPYVVLSLVGYGVGIPATFCAILWTQRDAIQRDMELYRGGGGDSADTNPDYGVRRRYSRLYIDYRVRPVSVCAYSVERLMRVRIAAGGVLVSPRAAESKILPRGRRSALLAQPRVPGVLWCCDVM